jgi:MFS family permease
MQLFLIGLLVYALTYSLFALQNSHRFIIVGFILYGLFYAFTQGTTKVLLIEQVPADQKSSAIGFYEGLNSFSLLIANAFAGWIWFRFGSATMLTYSSLITILIFMFMAWLYIIQPKLKGIKK